MITVNEICDVMVNFLGNLIENEMYYMYECPVYIYDSISREKTRRRIDLAAYGDGFSFAVEIKRNKQDLLSGCGLNFVADMCFLAISNSCYVNNKDIIHHIRKKYPYIYTEIIDDNTKKIIKELNCLSDNGLNPFPLTDQIIYEILHGII